MLSRSIKIIPAIDILNGQCVRLKKGDYNESKVYDADPVKVAQNFKNQGIKYLHIVDLDGAKEGSPVNLNVIENIIKTTDLKVQVGGGIRTLANAESLFNIGVAKIIIGSMLVQDPKFFESLIKKYGKDKIIAGIDAKDDMAAIAGWLESTETKIEDLIQNAINLGAEIFVITDINKDGMLAGPNLEMYQKIDLKFPKIKLIASGGVSCQNDINELSEMEIYGAIVGKAIYENKIKIYKSAD